MGAFDKQIFKDQKVVEKIFEFWSDGSKTIFLLNTLILTDITLWKNSHLIELIEKF